VFAVLLCKESEDAPQTQLFMNQYQHLRGMAPSRRPSSAGLQAKVGCLRGPAYVKAAGEVFF